MVEMGWCRVENAAITEFFLEQNGHSLHTLVAAWGQLGNWRHLIGNNVSKIKSNVDFVLPDVLAESRKLSGMVGGVLGDS